MSDGGGNRWLREHFHTFVFPAFMAAEKKSTEIGSPFNVKISPQAPEELPTELRKLWTLCMDMKVPWEYDVREVNSHSGSSKYRESARIHNRILNDTLKSAQSTLRHEGCSRLFLGGRDVWTYAVLCSRIRIPYMFVPELSRTVSSRAACKPFLESCGFTGDELFLDTGFAGSIPRNLQKFWPGQKFKFRLMSQDDVQVVEEYSPKSELIDCDPFVENKTRKVVTKPSKYRRRPNQIFPNRAKARSEALETEYLAKYWKSGTYEPLVTQGFAPRVFEEWRNRISADGLGIRRFVKRVHNVQNLGLYDGHEVVFVGENDLHLVPGFKEWWISLPTVNEPKVSAESETIVQYFSDRRAIQRAALLTSMLWRGIPYWKAAMKKLVQTPVGIAYNAIANNVVWGTNVITTGVTSAGTTATFSINGSQFNTFTPTTPTGVAVTQNMTSLAQPSLNSTVNGAIGQQITQSMLAELALKAEMAVKKQQEQKNLKQLNAAASNDGGVSIADDNGNLNMMCDDFIMVDSDVPFSPPEPPIKPSPIIILDSATV